MECRAICDYNKECAYVYKYPYNAIRSVRELMLMLIRMRILI